MNSPLFVVIAMVGLIGCSVNPFASNDSNGLALSLTLSSQQVDRGQPDTIAVTIANNSAHAVSVSAGGCPILFYITNADGSTVVPSGGKWVCLAVLTQLTFAPRESQTQNFVWDTNALAAGRYSVYGTFTATGVHLETAPVIVQLN